LIESGLAEPFVMVSSSHFPTCGVPKPQAAVCKACGEPLIVNEGQRGHNRARIWQLFDQGPPYGAPYLQRTFI